MKVKVLGTGCTKCRKLHKKIALLCQDHEELDVEYINDIAEIMKYGVMSVPVLVIDEEIKVAGRVPSDRELNTLLGLKDG